MILLCIFLQVYNSSQYTFVVMLVIAVHMALAFVEAPVVTGMAVSQIRQLVTDSRPILMAVEGVCLACGVLDTIIFWQTHKVGVACVVPLSCFF